MALRKKLKVRAARAGMPLHGCIPSDVARQSEQPTLAEWFKKLREMKPIVTKESSADAIRAIRGR